MQADLTATFRGAAFSEHPIADLQHYRCQIDHGLSVVDAGDVRAPLWRSISQALTSHIQARI